MNRIAELRKEKNMSQISLGMKLNVSQKMISAYENGKNEPSIDLLIRMADIFHVSIELSTVTTSWDTQKTGIPSTRFPTAPFSASLKRISTGCSAICLTETNGSPRVCFWAFLPASGRK